ncbi:protein tyrosine phosphatase non-receptor type 21, partial [Homo sapiens]
ATTGLKMKHLLTGQERTVWHLQYTDWPEHGCPEDLKGFLSYLEEIQSVRRHTNSTSDPQSPNPPLLVHCSAGHPESAGHAEATENDAGADSLPVHICVQSPHPVPEKLQAHLSSHNFLRGQSCEAFTA